MQEITLIRPVTIAIKVTEDYRAKVVQGIQKAISDLDTKLQQLDFQYRRMMLDLEKRNPGGILAAKQSFEKEQTLSKESKQKLLERLKEIGNWSMGQEIIQGQMDSLVKLEVGDNWSGKMKAEVILEDGILVEIR